MSILFCQENNPKRGNRKRKEVPRETETETERQQSRKKIWQPSRAYSQVFGSLQHLLQETKRCSLRVTEREDSEERDRVKETERLVTASQKRLGDLAELIAKSLVASNKSSL